MQFCLCTSQVTSYFYVTALIIIIIIYLPRAYEGYGCDAVYCPWEISLGLRSRLLNSMVTFTNEYEVPCLFSEYLSDAKNVQNV